MKKSGEASESVLILDQLEGIKRLLMLSLARDGAKQEEIALALGVSQPTVNRMLPKGLGKNSKSN